MLSPSFYTGLLSPILGFVAIVFFLAGSVTAQAGPPQDLGTVLAGEADLSKYYSLIKVTLDKPYVTNTISRLQKFRNSPSFFSNCRILVVSR
jgi:hypothetical protein